MQGLAKIEAAHGRLASAIRRYENVVTRLPLPQYLAELADLYETAGDRAGAQGTFDLLTVQERLFRANGVNIDLEQALFDADHGVRVASGLRSALEEWRRRKSVFVADAVAWSLYANGRYRQALAFTQQAFRVGTRSAMFFFHRGMIERELGLRSMARRDLQAAVRINPSFSFRWGPRMRDIIGRIG
jgi:tetratricopeptide (TPR) repeat protein